MSLVIYNTLTRRLDPFEPLHAGRVSMYCCGVTVYDYSHLGHARSYIVWDTVRRYLQWRGYDVQYVQNFTDIDDKIIKRANESNTPWQALTATFIDAYLEDMSKLNILPADTYPKATETIPEMLELIQSLIDRGIAYVSEGDVYYAVERFPAYGALSGQPLDQMQMGAGDRVKDEESRKRHPMDFALWKSAKPGEPTWESPWGPGRPGWHIECSAMVRKILGDRIDIHTGGQDLIFPHHENERAQSEAVTDQPLATYWMHNGFVKIGGDKMSKSLNNFETIRSLLEIYDPMVVRLFVLQAQYRKPIDFNTETMTSAQNSWQTLKEGLLFGADYADRLDWSNQTVALDQDAIAQFQTAMDEDFNTAGALAVLFEFAKDLQRSRNLLIHEGCTDRDSETVQQQWQTLVHLASVLGLAAHPVDPTTDTVGMSDVDIEALIEQRSDAKKAKNFAEADRIRTELAENGITLIDKPGGVTQWHR